MFGLKPRDLVGVLLASAVIGAIAGLLWWWWAPRVVLEVFGEQAFPVEFQPAGYITDSGLAALLCVAGGAITAAIVIVVARSRNASAHHPGVLVWTILSGFAGALMMWWLGSQLGAVDLDAAIAEAGDGGQITSGLQLRMPGIIVLWPLMSSMILAIGSIWTWVFGGLGSSAQVDQTSVGQSL